MNNKCINLKIRSKKGAKYFFCARRKDTVERKECFSCLNREFKQVAKMTVKTKIKPISKTNKITKATSITKKVKMEVWERDNHRCIFCQKEVSWNYANSHYIKRSQLGMGIPENIMTNCQECHNLFEESTYRENMKEFARNYFINKYSYWNEDMLVYKKYQQKKD